MDNKLSLARRDAETFLALGKSLIEKAEELKVEDESGVVAATEILKQCQTAEKDLEEKRVSIVKDPNDFIKMVNGLFKETVNPLAEAKQTIKAKIVDYNLELEKRKREAEEKRLAEERARLAKLEEERKAREAEERAKREAEEKKLAEERAQLSAEQAKLEEEKIKIEREKRLMEEEKNREVEEARLAEEARKKEEQEANLMSQNVKGIVRTMKWEIVNESAIPRAFCSPDSKKINSAVKAGVRTIEGLRIYEDMSVR